MLKIGNNLPYMVDDINNTSYFPNRNLNYKKVSFTNKLKSGIDYLEKNYDAKEIVLYTNYDNFINKYNFTHMIISK